MRSASSLDQLNVWDDEPLRCLLLNSATLVVTSYRAFIAMSGWQSVVIDSGRQMVVDGGWWWLAVVGGYMSRRQLHLLIQALVFSSFKLSPSFQERASTHSALPPCYSAASFPGEDHTVRSPSEYKSLSLMATACVNSIDMPPENFLGCPPFYPSYNWFGPEVSFSRENVDSKNGDVEKLEVGLNKSPPADELFSDGKLVPLQLALVRADADQCPPKVPVRLSPEPIKSQLRFEIAGSDDDLHEFSPKAPKCSSRWKQLLCLKKVQSPIKPAHLKSTFVSSMAENARSLKHFLHRNSKSSSSTDSLSLPLLRDSDSESVSISSRLSLSSSSSSADHEDIPRFSFDFDKPIPNQISTTPLLLNQPRMRFAKIKSSALDGNVALRSSRTRCLPDSGEISPPRVPSVDSPRLNASGKVIFQGLERSSSSPSTFNGGPRPRSRRMERSYSANVRVAPVLNVPVCTLPVQRCLSLYLALGSYSRYGRRRRSSLMASVKEPKRRTRRLSYEFHSVTDLKKKNTNFNFVFSSFSGFL
ncbi:uncharacterized protein LOC110021288 [Phalaenopsis equestris]|uniref:uncharacterized protein LOC110021288 n=1 Tax=Phalaenopsis equestris TaxID=78828 RepID=UPI0009E64F57|nr:uncharacterized protein LOC110021288 [Phalaenopsis equestris]